MLENPFNKITHLAQLTVSGAVVAVVVQMCLFEHKLNIYYLKWLHP